MIFHTFLVYLQIILQNYGTNQCLAMHWLKHKCARVQIWFQQVMSMPLELLGYNCFETKPRKHPGNLSSSPAGPVFPCWMLPVHGLAERAVLVLTSPVTTFRTTEKYSLCSRPCRDVWADLQFSRGTNYVS